MMTFFAGPGSGFSQPQNSSAVPNYGSTVPNYGSTFPSQTTAPQVIIIGGCPACHVSLYVYLYEYKFACMYEYKLV